MAQKKIETIVLIVLAVIGALAILAVLGMWLMHVTMMGSTLGTSGISAVAGGISTSLFTGLIVAAVSVLFSAFAFLRPLTPTTPIG